MHKNKDLLSTYNLHKKRCKDILKLGKSKHEGKKKEHLFGKHIMQHRAWVKLQYMESKNAVTLIIQYRAFLVDFLQKFSEELCT